MTTLNSRKLQAPQKQLLKGPLVGVSAGIQIVRNGKTITKSSIHQAEVERQQNKSDGQLPRIIVPKRSCLERGVLLYKRDFSSAEAASLERASSLTPYKEYGSNKRYTEYYLIDIRKVENLEKLDYELCDPAGEFKLQPTSHLPYPSEEGVLSKHGAYNTTENTDKVTCASSLIKKHKLDIWCHPIPIENTSNLPRYSLNNTPKPLSAITNCLASSVGCPPEFIAISALTLLGAVIGHKIHIQPTTDITFIATCTLWGVLIADPGVKKTPAMEAVLNLIQPVIEEIEEVYKHEREKQKSNEDVHKLVHQITLSMAKEIIQEAALFGDERKLQAAQREAARLLQPVHQKAIASPKKRLVASDFTFASLFNLLTENPNGILLFVDEIIGLLAKASRKGNEELKGLLLQAFNGFGIFEVDRATHEHQSTQDANVCILGSIQPGKFVPYLQSAQEDCLDNDGFIHRFQLMIYSSADDWSSACSIKNPQKVINKIQSMLKDLVEHHFFDENTPFKERVVPFSNDAQAVYDEWWEDFSKQFDNISSGAVKAHFRKFQPLPAKIALIFTVIESYNYTERHFKPVEYVALPELEKAIAFTEYLAKHAQYLLDASQTTSQLDAIRLSETLNSFEGTFTRRDVNQRNLSGIRRDTQRAQSALNYLVEHNWLKCKRVGRTERYVVNPHINKGSD